MRALLTDTGDKLKDPRDQGKMMKGCTKIIHIPIRSRIPSSVSFETGLLITSHPT